MAKVTTQVVPSELILNYRRFLQGVATLFQTDYAKKRNPLRRPPVQKALATPAQLAVRRTFRECTECFKQQPDTGGATPPAEGPRNRSWWYDTAAAIKPFHPHGNRILGWDGDALSGQKRPGSDRVYRLIHEHIKVNEQDFLDFYEDMKPLYGYPWSATNDPDEIAFKMWRIVAGEIEYSGYTYAFMALTPGETSKKGTGDCEDESILFFALLWKALLEVGYGLSWVNSHVSLVYLDLGEEHHAYCWYKDKNDDTRIIECTSKTADLPANIYGAPLFTTGDPTWLYTRASQAAEYEPWTIVAEEDQGLFYYNYFMQQTLNSLFADVTPVWCKPQVAGDTRVSSGYPNTNFGLSTYLHLRHRSYDQDDLFFKHDTYLMPPNSTRYLHLYCLWAIQENSKQYITIKIDIRKINSLWIENAVTWNTKPSYGSIVSTKEITLDFGDPPEHIKYFFGWYKFSLSNIDTLPFGVAFVQRESADLNCIIFAVSGYEVVARRPYLTRN